MRPTGSAPHGLVQLGLLVINSLALGVQSSAVLRFGVSGLSTTYLTGTLTTLVSRLVSGHSLKDVAHSMTILAGLVGGAALMTAVLHLAPVAAPFVQLAFLAAALAIAARAHETPE